MEQILGKEFCIENVKYTVVDVRNIGGDTMVYAQGVYGGHVECDSEGENVNSEQASEQEGGPRGPIPGRAAFHYTDIESHLVDQASDAA